MFSAEPAEGSAVRSMPAAGATYLARSRPSTMYVPRSDAVTTLYAGPRALGTWAGESAANVAGATASSKASAACTVVRKGSIDMGTSARRTAPEGLGGVLH